MIIVQPVFASRIAISIRPEWPTCGLPAG